MSWYLETERKLATGANPQILFGDGTIYEFNGDGNGHFLASPENPGVSLTLIDSVLGIYEFLDLDGRLDRYETSNGVVSLVRSRLSNGSVVTFSYDAANLLASVTDEKARSIVINRSGAVITSIVTPTSKISYEYDTLTNAGGAIAGTELLVRVIQSKLDGSDPATVTYHYENLSIPSLLTGVTDESGVRFATYAYDGQGRAIMSEHANGAERVTLAFDDGTGNTAVTDALGATRTYGFVQPQLQYRNTGVSQPGGSGCAPSAASMAYDSYGNMTSRVDFNGQLSCFSYDTARALMTKRVEGLSGASCPGTVVPGLTKTTSIQWHPTLRMKASVAEAGRLSTLSYDPSGNLLSNAMQATNDPTGALGFAAVVQGPTRTQAYTYNSQNQVLIEDGPLAGSADSTTYEYYANTDTQVPPRWRQWDLKKKTNAQGHATTFDSYDASGRVTQTTNPNGVVTSITYHFRGWITAVTQTSGGTSQTVSYDYWPTGKLKKVVQADGSFLSYSYDAAQRLTGIVDNLGNTVSYTLDAAGNRTAESFKDTGGVLKRNIARSFDALSRVQSVTGAMQ